jgi:hypothetical protein
VKRRSEQRQHLGAGLLSHFNGGGGKPTLAYPTLALERDSSCRQRAGLRLRPASLEEGGLMLPADQWSESALCGVAFGNCLIVDDRFVHALHRLRRPGLELERTLNQPFNRRRDRDGTRIGEAAYSCGHIGTEAVHVTCDGIEIDDSVIDADADADVEPETLSHALAEIADLAGEVECRLHRSVRVILVGEGMAENREQPVAVRRTDIALVAVDDLNHLVAVPADHGAVNLRLDARGQRRRIDQIGEENGQAPDLAMIIGGGEQFLGVGIAAIDSEHLFGECVGRRPVATVDCPHRTIE